MANPLSMNSLLSQVNSMSQLSLVRQLGFVLILAAGIALGTATVLWSVNSGYTALYSGLSSQDSADVVGSLEQSGVRYRVDGVSGIIMVPADDLHRIRMQLANQGLPRSSSRGFEILDEEQGIGTSNFVEQARYNRALEQELVQTIKQIQGVRDARVHLSIPRQSSFIRNSRAPSASVMIDIAGSQGPGDTQLSGIVHLVASSVAGLETARVSIVDQRGNLLSERSDSELGNSTEAIRFTRRVEEDYSNRIIDLLTPIVGVGNVRAQVAANIDFTAMETTQELYNPDTLVIRSEQLEEERSDLNNDSATAEPGSLSATPPAEPAEGDAQENPERSSQTRTSSVRNYEVDRSVSHTRTVPGAIDQLSVAVLVDLTAGSATTATGEAGGENLAATQEVIDARLVRLNQLVKDAVGFNQARGDTVSVINEQFYTDTPLPLEPIPFWQQSWFGSLLKQLGAGLIVLLLIFAVLRPALKAVVISQGGTRRSPSLTGGDPGDLGDEKVRLSGNSREPQLAGPGGTHGISFDDNLARAQNLVMQEPNRAARMIQNWMASE